MSIIKRLRMVLIKVEEFSISVMLALMFLLVVLNVALRSANLGFTWVEELARWLFIWGVLIGSALGLEREVHFRMTLVFEVLPNIGKKVVSYGGSILVVTFIIIYFYLSAKLCLSVADETSGGLLIPMGLLYLPMPISAFLMLVQLGLKVVSKNDSGGGS